LKGLKWNDVDLFSRTLTVRKSKTLVGERLIPLTDVAIGTFVALRRRAERFGKVEPSHYVFATFFPKYKLSDDKPIEPKAAAFDPSKSLKGWRTAWRSLTKKAGLPGFRFHDLRHCAILSSRRVVRLIQQSWQSRDMSAEGCWSGTAMSGWRQNEKRWKRLLLTREWRVTTQTTTQNGTRLLLVPSKPLETW